MQAPAKTEPRSAGADDARDVDADEGIEDEDASDGDPGPEAGAGE